MSLPIAPFDLNPRLSAGIPRPMDGAKRAGVPAMAKQQGQNSSKKDKNTCISPVRRSIINKSEASIAKIFIGLIKFWFLEEPPA